MARTIFTNGEQHAVIVKYDETHYEVTAYVGEKPRVAYDATTYEAAERWAKAVIEYQD